MKMVPECYASAAYQPQGSLSLLVLVLVHRLPSLRRLRRSLRRRRHPHPPRRIRLSPWAIWQR